MTRTRYLPWLLGLLLIALMQAAHAQWPQRPVRLLVPFPPGGLSDAMMRVVAEQAGQRLGQPVVVENKPGASGRMMYSELNRAAPDGHTIGYISTSAPVLSLTARDLDYDVRRDFQGLALIGSFGGYIAVSAEVAAADAQELVAYARQRPGGLAYGSFGIGSQTHLQTELLLSELGIEMNHVPYKGEAPIIQALARNEIQFAILASYPEAMIDAGRVRVIASTLPQSPPVRPTVPTVRSIGMESIETSAWAGIAAPAGLPAEVAERLSAAFIDATRSAQVRQRLFDMGYVVRGEGAEAIAQALAGDLEYYGRALAATGLTPETIANR